ncbi:hypothetical protein ACMGE9_12355 [Macrococcus sp. EM39E]|uniref:hypothetical protein n=1 Tax=Macrococcus animalis TaxID=3395467 RepID=UPI0039BE2A0F
MKKYLCIKSTFSEKQGAVYEIGKGDREIIHIKKLLNSVKEKDYDYYKYLIEQTEFQVKETEHYLNKEFMDKHFIELQN